MYLNSNFCVITCTALGREVRLDIECVHRLKRATSINDSKTTYDFPLGFGDVKQTIAMHLIPSFVFKRPSYSQRVAKKWDHAVTILRPGCFFME